MLRYALSEYDAPKDLRRGYFGAIDPRIQLPVIVPGTVAPICVLHGVVPRIDRALWTKPGTTGTRAGMGPEAILCSRTHGPLYHRRQRCLVPASGYYERAASGTAYDYVRSPDRSLLAFAGVWMPCAMAGADIAFTIVSCGQLRPLILSPEHYDAWFNDADPRHLLRLRPLPWHAARTGSSSSRLHPAARPLSPPVARGATETDRDAP